MSYGPVAKVLTTRPKAPHQSSLEKNKNSVVHSAGHVHKRLLLPPSPAGYPHGALEGKGGPLDNNLNILWCFFISSCVGQCLLRAPVERNAPGNSPAAFPARRRAAAKHRWSVHSGLPENPFDDHLVVRTAHHVCSPNKNHGTFFAWFALWTKKSV